MKHNNNKKKIFIEALEQRIMLDGAGASTFLDLIDERNQDKILDKKSKKITKFSENKIDDKSEKLPFAQLVRDQKRNERKQVVFIDSQVQDYQTLINSFNKDTEVCLIQSNEDGFKKIDSVLKDNQNISSLHIIGHGSAGKILFGNATLSNDTIQSYNQTLRSIGQSLTDDGDILFYGCNVASTDGGKTLISKISEVTKADIAASDDVTGQGGDWDLEKKIGIVETQNVKVVDYKHYLANGVASVSGDMEEGHDADNFNTQDVGSGGYQSSGTGYFVVTRERANVSNGTITLDKDDDGNNNVSLNTDTYAVDVYLVFMNDTENNKTDRVDHIGSITFDNEIYGIMWDDDDTIAMSGFDKSGATYPTSNSQRGYENTAFHANNDVSSGGPSGDDDVDKETDWVSVSSNQRTLRTGVKNNTPGDYMRVFVATASNNAPVARNDVGVIAEDGTLTVDNGDNANVSGSYDATGEHSGDVLQTSSTTHYDTDADSDALVVASVRTGGSEGSGSAGTLGAALTGTYGQLTLNANGSYTYVANQSAADDLDDGDSVTDVFNYTVSDGNGGTDTATITITVLGINDTPVAANNTGVVNEDGTLTVADGASANSITTAAVSHDSSPFSVGSQEILPATVSFSNDGTKMFVAGNTGDDVNEYTLSTAFDVSTASYDSNFSMSSQLNEAFGIAWNLDGTKMFVADAGSGDDINEYTLSTAFDVSTASFVDSLDVSGQDSRPCGIRFNNDGTKLFMTGFASDYINEYNLSTAFDISSGSYSQRFSVNSQDIFPRDVQFNLDGTRMFVMGGAGDDINEYTLSTGFDVSTASFVDSLSVSSQETEPFSMTFNNDGTKMFMMGYNGDDVNEYSLVSPYNLINVTGEHDGDVLGDDTDADDSASLTVTSYRTGASEGSGTAAGSVGSALTGTYGQLTLNANGSYTYVANQSAADDLDAGDVVTDSFNYTVSDGTATDTATIVITVIGINDSVTAANNTGVVNEDGTLSVSDGASANSITTAAASHDSSPFDVSSQETEPMGLAFNTDGTKMFVVGYNGDDVNEYTLSTAFDVSTASFVDSFDVSSQETRPLGLAFNNDGTKMFVSGDTGDDVNEYTLSTGFDVSSASFVDSFDISSQETSPYGLAFNIDGTKMFVAGASGDDVNEYTLSTGFDVSSASFVDSFDVSSQETAPTGLAFSADGTKMFVSGDTGDDVNEYSLVSPYSLINVTGEHDGDVLGDDTDADDSASLTVASVRTGASEGSGTAGTIGSALTGTYGQLTLNANGSYTYVANQSAADDLDAGDVVTDSFNYTVSDGTATDTATIVITVIGINDSVTAANNTGIVNEDGTLTVADGASANSITTAAASHDSSPFDISNEDTTPQSLVFNPDGTKMFVVGRAGKDINEYTLSTGFDVSTASFVDSFDVRNEETQPKGVAFNNDGTKMFVVGYADDEVLEYNLSSGFDVSTATFVDGFSVRSEDLIPSGLAFNNDGTKMFVVGQQDDDVNEYTLSTGFDVSTASFVDAFDVSNEELSPLDLKFNYNGTRMFVTGYSGKDVNEYTLSTGFDVSTASFVDSFSVSSEESAPTGLAFNHDGTKMFVSGKTGDDVNEYSLVSPFNLIDVTAEHDGDVLGDDTDADDSASLTVTSVRIGASEGSGSAGTLGSALTGTYGQLTLNANGSYTYVANQSATDDLDAGDVVTDSFNYTVSDGTSTDTATIVITVIGINDAPAAVNDTDSVDANETTTATNGSSNDVLTDDTDVDDHDSLSVTAIQPSGGSSSSVSTGSSYNSNGTEVTGTYGTLTIGADGSYTYVADQDAADNISSGSSETDVFTYTVSDGTTTTTATLTITVSGIEAETPTEDDKKETKKEKKENKQQRKEAKKQRKAIKRAKRFISKNLDLPKTLLPRKAEFNQGLKLVDLVAESKTTEVKEKNVYADKVKTKITKEGLKVNFKVFNDEGKEVQKYYGVMKDGSSLPKWIQVDPKTGKTKTNIPKGTKVVEFKIISIDEDNNKKQVTVVIDPKKIANDKEIIKQNKKLAKAKKIEVSNDGVVKLNSIDKDGSVDKTVTDTLNDGSKSLKDIARTIKPNEFLKLESNLRGNEHVVDLPVSLHFLLQYELKTSFENLKIVLKDGQELPNWIKFDPNSAKIISNPPKDVSSIDLKIIVEDPNGETIVKDLTINFSKENSSTTEKILDTNNEFVTLTAQLSKEHAKLNDYGSQVIDSL